MHSALVKFVRRVESAQASLSNHEKGPSVASVENLSIHCIDPYIYLIYLKPSWTIITNVPTYVMSTGVVIPYRPLGVVLSHDFLWHVGCIDG